MNVLGKMFEAMVERVALLRKISYYVLGGLVVLDFIIPRAHVEHFWDSIPGFHAFYGFVACAVIIIVSKFLGKYWLMKREDYYD